MLITIILVLWIIKIIIEICNVFIILKNKLFNNDLFFYILLLPLFIVSSEHILYFILIRVFDKIFEKDNNYLIILILKILLIVNFIYLL